MPLYLYAFIGYELFQIKLYITILRFQFCNQPAEWSLLEQGLTQRPQKIEGHLLFWLFCVAPFCCAVNCFRKKCGKET